MPTESRNRVLGLSAKARRLVFPLVGVAVGVVVVGTLTTRAGSDGDGPIVGGDLHAVGELGGRLFVGGHAGAGYESASGSWEAIATLDDKDVMAWAQSGEDLLAGGHGGLFRSVDGGSTFAAVDGLPVSDVHAVGAAGQRIYVGSPESGVLVSEDGGNTFTPTGSAGQDFMGTIWVDPSDPDVAIAPSMQSGVVKTTDGGATWTALGSEPGSMAVAVDRSGARLTAVGMAGAQSSLDGGATWTPLEVPEATTAATYTSSGELVVATLSGERAQLNVKVNGEWDQFD